MNTSIRSIGTAFIAAAILSGPGFGQSQGDQPVKVALCEVLKSPERFNGKMVEIRAEALQIAIGLGEGLRDDACSGRLFFGGDGFPALSGGSEYAFINTPADLQHPERLVWKPIRLPPPVEFIRTEGFDEYKKYVFQRLKNPDGSTRFDCPAFDITMTVIGRFDYVDHSLVAIKENPSAKPSWRLAGFGHMQGSMSRLVWQSVLDVVVRPIAPSTSEKR
jgi:hypothetical protein